MGINQFPAANRFETILADTTTWRDIHFRFRYKVFCEETGFEDASAFPDEKEHDDYDDASVHFIVWDHLNQCVAGAMRLVDASYATLPVEDTTDRQVCVPRKDRTRSIEFSRLCIDRRCSRIHQHDGVGVKASSQTWDDGRSTVLFHQEDNEILLRLIRANLGWSAAQGKEYCYFLITRTLARALQRLGVVMDEAGNSVEHRGTRIPFVARIPETHKKMSTENNIYKWLVSSCESYVTASSLLPQPIRIAEPAGLSASTLEISEAVPIRPLRHVGGRGVQPASAFLRFAQSGEIRRTE